ncbi:MAG TPA: carbohydrate ABC transporter permease [Spirochaetia bacterium]|nr:carbohydrate ABC transporter permease [Spirochaetia bacterium]HRZ65675.1 carbohydrate ABC transporter permease [Spirochaetia bacterium]
MSRAKALRAAGKGLSVAALSVAGLPFVFPFWWMLTSAVKSPGDVFGRLSLLPSKCRWDNFAEIFSYQPFARHYLNSLCIAAVVTAATILLASLSGYAFARVRFRGRSALFLVLLSSMMMPAEVTIIPNFFMMKQWRLIDTHVPLVILGVFGAQGAFSAFVMRQYFLSMPKELEEAARIDGLGRLSTFARIILPLATPAISATAILTALDAWNSFLQPLIFINDLNKFTLPLSLNNFRDAYGSPVWHLQMAATAVSVIPILLFYVCAQRKIINAMVFSGMKG